MFEIVDATSLADCDPMVPQRRMLPLTKSSLTSTFTNDADGL